MHQWSVSFAKYHKSVHWTSNLISAISVIHVVVIVFAVVVVIVAARWLFIVILFRQIV